MVIHCSIYCILINNLFDYGYSRHPTFLYQKFLHLIIPCLFSCSGMSFFFFFFLWYRNGICAWLQYNGIKATLFSSFIQFMLLLPLIYICIHTHKWKVIFSYFCLSCWSVYWYPSKWIQQWLPMFSFSFWIAKIFTLLFYSSHICRL